MAYESYIEIKMIASLEDPPTCDTQLLIILRWGHRREHGSMKQDPVLSLWLLKEYPKYNYLSLKSQRILT